MYLGWLNRWGSYSPTIVHYYLSVEGGFDWLITNGHRLHLKNAMNVWNCWDGWMAWIYLGWVRYVAPYGADNTFTLMCDQSIQKGKCRKGYNELCLLILSSQDTRHLWNKPGCVLVTKLWFTGYKILFYFVIAQVLTYGRSCTPGKRMHTTMIKKWFLYNFLQKKKKKKKNEIVHVCRLTT